MRREEGGIIADQPVEFGMLDRLHQPQMPLGQDQIAATGQRAEDRQADLLEPQFGQPFVTRARHAVQDHPATRNSGS